MEKTAKNLWLSALLTHFVLIIITTVYLLFFNMLIQFKETNLFNLIFNIQLVFKITILIQFISFVCFWVRMFTQNRVKYFFILYHLYFFITIPMDMFLQRCDEKKFLQTIKNYLLIF
ncbi:hypothetical protein SCLARK_00745 [Spiroplasma clarkii]|nr:hypothetical protein SCLARK_00745 [Spiroplasma clarkii]